jgi:hypothetical protein
MKKEILEIDAAVLFFIINILKNTFSFHFIINKVIFFG